ncbi:hypothetical protein [Microbacterium sp.]|uniref:hypothetical protein n=1 Tax=Microbacterium sp. TaxID=51671 RepID=UPI00356A1A54
MDAARRPRPTVAVTDLADALDLIGGDIHAHARSVRHWDPGTAQITALAELRQA